MKAVEFCYWLQGYFEIQEKNDVAKRSSTLTISQVKDIQKHLSLVFKHEIDPSYKDSNALNEIHNPDKQFDGLIRC